MTAGIPTQHRLFSVADFIAEVQLSASLEAQVSKCVLTVSYVDSKLALDADRELLLAALANLLQNAFKFTHPRSEVLLKVYAMADRIRIEVEDKCGGLPPGDAERMFLAFTQGGADRSGLGLGLSISRRSVEANGGTLTVRDIEAQGCVFTIDLPRHAMSELTPDG
jgi:signal transduction histidine kinase